MKPPMSTRVRTIEPKKVMLSTVPSSKFLPSTFPKFISSGRRASFADVPLASDVGWLVLRLIPLKAQLPLAASATVIGIKLS